jgi:hypothetical protein
LEVGDTAGLETRATKAGGCCPEKTSRNVTRLRDGTAKAAKAQKQKRSLRLGVFASLR